MTDAVRKVEISSHSRLDHLTNVPAGYQGASQLICGETFFGDMLA